jgi:hypothetical protein
MTKTGYPPEPVLNLLKELPDNTAAQAAGVSRKTIQRWRQGALIAVRNADTVACALGHHPLELWPDWRDAQAPASAAQQLAELRTAAEVFLRSRPHPKSVEWHTLTALLPNYPPKDT